MERMITDEANRGVLKRLLRDYARAYAPRYAVAFAFMATVAACTSLSAWMMKDVINHIFVEQNREALLWIPLAIAALFVVKGFAAYFQEVSMSQIGTRIVAEAQKRMYEHLLKMDVQFFQDTPSNDLITRMTQSAASARDVLNVLAVGLGRDCLTIAGLVFVMVAQDPMMSLICLVFGPVAAFGLKQLVTRAQQAAKSEINSQTAIVRHLRETVQGIRVIKSFQLEGAQRQRMGESIDAVERLRRRIVRVQASVNPLVETVGGLAVAAVVLYAGWRNISDTGTPGQFFAFITALLLAADPARRLSRMQVQLATSLVGVRMMYELLDRPAREMAMPEERDLVVRAGEIRFERVSFGYDPANLVLKDLSFTAPAGRMTALVGLSGSGKTTVFNVIQRFWTPSSGEILIDGLPLSELSLVSLRREIALVGQDIFLFDGTIWDNIRAGRPDADDAAVLAAARAAYADRFIRELPQGYQTPVGELGSQLSGGQRQRLALARAFLKDAAIILLDEPTAALDAETEQFVQAALKTLTRGRTTIVIAHRLATVMKADLIHVVSDGRIEESGTHNELVGRRGLYARLYEMQFAAA
jgi:subfamily B ATP-binding cassette protein MsbA